jgi:ElaB/YqjD/DUF883 family membrane-anchored ribosome-binding protein
MEGSNPMDLKDTAKSVADTAAETARSAADTARSYAPETYDRTAQAANYVSESIREHPWSASAVLPLLGYMLGFLLHHQWSDTGSTRYSGRSWTDTAASTAQSAADTVRSAADRSRSAAPETYDRLAQAVNSRGGRIGLVSVVAAVVIGYALGLAHKSD